MRYLDEEIESAKEYYEVSNKRYEAVEELRQIVAR